MATETEWTRVVVSGLTPRGRYVTFGNSIFVLQYRNRHEHEHHDVFERCIIIGLGLHSVVISHFRNIPIVLLEAQWHYGATVTYSSWPCST